MMGMGWGGGEAVRDRPICKVGLSGGLSRDRAADAGAAETAIAGRVFRQILLMVRLGEIERWRVGDLGRDPAQPGYAEAVLIDLARRFGGLSLRRGEDVDRRTVLGADIVALAHPLRRIM